MPNPIHKVDEENKVIGVTTITEARNNNWYRQIARVFIISTDGKYLLLQKRSDTMFAFPGYWDMSGGHVDYGESYEEAGRREIKEELGIDTELIQLTECIKGKDTFSVIFKAHIPKDMVLNLDPSEVAETKWVPIASIDDLLLKETHIADWMKESWLEVRDKLMT